MSRETYSTFSFRDKYPFLTMGVQGWGQVGPRKIQGCPVFRNKSACLAQTQLRQLMAGPSPAHLKYEAEPAHLVNQARPGFLSLPTIYVSQLQKSYLVPTFSLSHTKITHLLKHTHLKTN